MTDKNTQSVSQRTCGKSDLTLSALGAGCWAFGGGDYWGDQNQKDVDQVVHHALELGINYFDSAEAYNEGRSETSLGQAIKGLPRDQVCVGTKVSPSNLYHDTLIEHCEASLRRLDTDYIDLYMIHWPVHPHSIRHFTKDQAVIDSPPDINEAFDALAKLCEQGKIRYVGVSNFAVPRLEPLADMPVPVVANELPYSLLTRTIECEVLPYCQQNGIGVIGYMTLLQGVLADIYPTLADVPEWQRRTRHFDAKRSSLTRHNGPGAEKETNQALADIRKIAQQAGLTMPALAVKWALANSTISCALVGARNAQELQANVDAAANPLDQDTLDALNQATEPLKNTLGTSFDYYESPENDRTR